MPVVDRVNWLRHQVERGRMMHISYGASTRAGVLTVKVILRPLQYGLCDGSLQSFQLIHVESLWRLVTAHHSADRGHKMSDGTSTVRFWVTLDGNSSLDNISYVDSAPPPIPPPVLPMRVVDDSVDIYDHDVSMEVIDTQNHAILALSEHVSQKIDLLGATLAALQADIGTQFARSRAQIVAGLDGLDGSLDSYFNQQPVSVALGSSMRLPGLPGSVALGSSMRLAGGSLLNVDADAVASMCVAVPCDAAVQCDISANIGTTVAIQTMESGDSLCRYMDRAVSRVPADESDSDDDNDDGLEHNMVALSHDFSLLRDDLFGKEFEEFGEVTCVYYDLDVEERLYEVEYGRQLHRKHEFDYPSFADGVE